MIKEGASNAGEAGLPPPQASAIVLILKSLRTRYIFEKIGEEELHEEGES